MAVRAHIGLALLLSACSAPRPSSHVQELLAQLDDPAARIRAARLLADHTDEVSHIEPVLLSHLGRASDPEFNRALLDALDDVGGPGTVRALTDMTRQENDDIEWVIASIWTRVGPACWPHLPRSWRTLKGVVTHDGRPLANARMRWVLDKRPALDSSSQVTALFAADERGGFEAPSPRSSGVEQRDDVLGVHPSLQRRRFSLG